MYATKEYQKIKNRTIILSTRVFYLMLKMYIIIINDITKPKTIAVIY